MSKVYNVISDRIIALLETGCVPWSRPWRCGAPKNLVSRRAYRGVNSLLLASMPFSSPWWITFNQARSQGGSVRKGEKGVPVIYFHRHTDENDEKTFAVLRYFVVFNMAQVDGIQIPEPPQRVTEPMAECERITMSYANGPTVRHGEPRAYYQPSADMVNMPARNLFLSSEDYYSTLWHELIHSTGAAHRLGRPGVVDPVAFGSHGYSLEELVAEIGSAFLAGEAGISPATINNSAAYVASWLRKLKDDRRLVVQAAAAAQRAADLVLGRAAGVSEGGDTRAA